jgi:hypothetical protein
MLPAFQGHDVAYVTTLESYRAETASARFYVVRDANFHRKLALAWMALHVALIVLWERPHLVISTGAAPGYFGLRVASLIGSRTIWVDSIANAEQLSLSGRRVGRYADLWLTQWPHLAGPEGPFFEGAVL